MEYRCIQTPTACEVMEQCHFFPSKILIEVMRSTTDVNTDADNEDDMEEDISRYIGFCAITLKTAILIADGIFSHYVNNSIFQDILERNIARVEKDSEAIFNENTIIALKGESVWSRA